MDPNESSWNYRVENLLKAIANQPVPNVSADNSDIITELETQTTALEAALSPLADLATESTVATQLAALLTAINTGNSARSSLVRQEFTGNAQTVIQNAIAAPWVAFDLIAVFVALTTNATVGNRQLTLELTAPDSGAHNQTFPLSNSRRQIYNGFQQPTIAASSSRTFLWTPNCTSDNWSRMQTGNLLLPTDNTLDLRWRIRNSGLFEAGDTMAVSFVFKVF